MTNEWQTSWGDHGSLRQLFWQQQPIIQPWGLETADSRAFFSLETSGWNATIKNHTNHTTPSSHESHLHVQMHEGEWKASLHEKATPRHLDRLLTFEMTRDTWAVDFVLRYVFRREVVTSATIANHKITWDGRNYYHQFPTDHVTLTGQFGTLQLQTIPMPIPTGWLLHWYVRCSPNEDAWVIHQRLLPQTWPREIIKIRLKGAHYIILPDLVAKWMIKMPQIGNHLRYAGEFQRRGGSRLNAYPMRLVPAGTAVSLHSHLVWS